MMFPDKIMPTDSGSFSRPMQHRMVEMQRHADQLFSIGWLRKRLWQEFNTNVGQTAATPYGDYRRVLLGSSERCFVWKFLSVYKKSLPDVRQVIENAYDDADPLGELIAWREDLIGEFARMQLSGTWEHVKDDDVSWRKFARRIFWSDASRQADIDRFFEKLDHIALITDILCGHADEYGLNVDYSSLERYQAGQRRENLTDEALVKAIEQWAAFLNGNSDWTVVYCVLRDDHGLSNASRFEREVCKLEFSKQLPDCPDGTVSRTMSNNPYMRLPIDKWPSDKKFTLPAREFRKCLKRQLE